MNMAGHLSPMDAIVFLAVAFAIAFLAAWMVSPGLRTWIERPKYRFQKDVQSYDQKAGTLDQWKHRVK
jgi:hypothetical protein